MEQARLKSSFIYLANAVNDLRGNWLVLGLVLAPLVLAGSLCLLPDAIDLQYDIVSTTEARGQSVVYTPAQTPHHAAPASPAKRPFSIWTLRILRILFALITASVNLVALCALRRMQRGERARTAVDEAIEVWRRAIPLLPSFFLIVLWQLLAVLIGAVVLSAPALLVCVWIFFSDVWLIVPPVEIGLGIVLGFLVWIWLYFSQYALVFEGRRSWPALIHSRDLMRGRFFKVATRIVVFLAVWSGYNSWAGGAAVVAGMLLRPIGYYAGLLSPSILVIDLFAVAVAYMTAAFFFAAGVRMYQDLNALTEERASLGAADNTPTLPLGQARA
ncbi:MAG: hypothetical protein WA005_16735 [Candidatus Binataceae bacterium]